MLSNDNNDKINEINEDYTCGPVLIWDAQEAK